MKTMKERLCARVCRAAIALILLLLCPLLAAADGEKELATPSTVGRLRVEGTRLVSEAGEPVQLRGVSTHGLAWFPQYVSAECFAQLRHEWNANVVRLAMYTAEYGGYCEGGDRQALERLVRDGVRNATEQDMYVIVDWHILSDNDPNLHIEEAKAFFDAMSAEYAGADNVLYEICNEPNGGTTWADVKAYTEQVIAVIRQNDADAIILVGTPNWSQDVDAAAQDPIADVQNVMYSLHFYAATHKDELRQKMERAIDAGLPVFVTEYGICDASGNGAIDEAEANRWIEALNARGVSYVAWNLSNKDESSAMLRPGCGKTSGFETDDLSACGLWVRDLLTGGFASGAPQGADGEASAAAAQTAQPQRQEETMEAPFAVFADGTLEATLTLRGSWEADGKPVWLFDMAVANVSQESVKTWAVDIPFDGEFALSDAWNGEFTALDGALHVESVSYNGTIAAGDSVRDVGFIVSGGQPKTE